MDMTAAEMIQKAGIALCDAADKLAREMLEAKVAKKDPTAITPTADMASDFAHADRRARAAEGAPKAGVDAELVVTVNGVVVERIKVPITDGGFTHTITVRPAPRARRKADQRPMVDSNELKVGDRLWNREGHKKTLLPYTVFEISKGKKKYPIGLLLADGSPIHWSAEYVSKNFTTSEPSYDYEMGDFLWVRAGVLAGTKCQVVDVHDGMIIVHNVSGMIRSSWSLRTPARNMSFFPPVSK